MNKINKICEKIVVMTNQQNLLISKQYGDNSVKKILKCQWQQCKEKTKTKVPLKLVKIEFGLVKLYLIFNFYSYLNFYRFIIGLKIKQ